MLPPDRENAQKYLTAKRHAFNDAVRKVTGESLQSLNVEDEIGKLIDQHYRIEPIVFDWEHFEKTDPGDQHNWVVRSVRVTGEVGLLAAKLNARAKPGVDHELKGSTFSVRVYTRNTAEDVKKQWEQIQATWNAFAAEALKVGMAERASDISFARQELTKKAENYRKKKLLE